MKINQSLRNWRALENVSLTESKKPTKAADLFAPDNLEVVPAKKVQHKLNTQSHLVNLHLEDSQSTEPNQISSSYYGEGNQKISESDTEFDNEELSASTLQHNKQLKSRQIQPKDETLKSYESYVQAFQDMQRQVQKVTKAVDLLQKNCKVLGEGFRKILQDKEASDSTKSNNDLQKEVTRLNHELLTIRQTLNDFKHSQQPDSSSSSSSSTSLLPNLNNDNNPLSTQSETMSTESPYSSGNLFSSSPRDNSNTNQQY